MNTKLTYRSRVRPAKSREMIFSGTLDHRDAEAILRLFGVIGRGFVPSKVGLKNLYEGPSQGSTIYSERKILSNMIHEILEVEETPDQATVNLGIEDLKKRLSVRG
mgnify:CR=1 FL=1